MQPVGSVEPDGSISLGLWVVHVVLVNFSPVGPIMNGAYAQLRLMFWWERSEVNVTYLTRCQVHKNVL